MVCDFGRFRLIRRTTWTKRGAGGVDRVSDLEIRFSTRLSALNKIYSCWLRRHPANIQHGVECRVIGAWLVNRLPRLVLVLTWHKLLAVSDLSQDMTGPSLHARLRYES